LDGNAVRIVHPRTSWVWLSKWAAAVLKGRATGR
jgi:hypothetical protein